MQLKIRTILLYTALRLRFEGIFHKKIRWIQVRRPVKRQSAQMNEKWEPKNRNFVENAKT